MSIRKTLAALQRFHRDEQGDEGVNKILIIAMIVVPLVIALILFGKDIVKFFSDAWKNLTKSSTDNSPEKSYDTMGS
jgi:Flp pilus assembly pilin Flp